MERIGVAIGAIANYLAHLAMWFGLVLSGVIRGLAERFANWMVG